MPEHICFILLGISKNIHKVRERAARTGRNPHTGEAIEIAAAKVPAFKPGKALKDAIQ